MPQMYSLCNTITSNLFSLDDNYNLSLIVYKSIDKNSNEFKEHINFYKQKNGYNAYFDLKYYMEIRPKYRAQNQNVFRINDTNLWQFMIALDNVSNWLVGKDKLFFKDENGNIKADKNNIIISGPYDTKLEFELAVRNIDNTPIMGIFIFLNEAADPIFLDAARFMNFKYFINNLNIYDAAMQMVLLMNVYEYNDNQGQNQIKQSKSKQLSFFDAVGAKKRGDLDE